jgi:hypothetical protein
MNCGHQRVSKIHRGFLLSYTLVHTQKCRTLRHAAGHRALTRPGTFTFSNQNQFALAENAANADVVLNATAAATGEHSFNLALVEGTNDQM